MSWRPYWKSIEKRHWSDVKGALLSSVPDFGDRVMRPSPGVENLSTLAHLKDIRDPTVLADAEGLRLNLLAEGVFLFQKCSHAQMAVARLAQLGMTSWALFNAYHSALLGAKASMSLLGVAFPKVAGVQLLLDTFPETRKVSSQSKLRTAPSYSSFRIVRLPSQMDQRFVWEAFQRVIRVTDGAWTSASNVQSIERLDWEAITPPRNAFLYKPQYWTTIDDVDADYVLTDWASMFEAELDTASDGFLIHLSMEVHRAVSWLMSDLAKSSNVFADQLTRARWPAANETNSSPCFKYFSSVAQ